MQPFSLSDRGGSRDHKLPVFRGLLAQEFANYKSSREEARRLRVAGHEMCHNPRLPMPQPRVPLVRIFLASPGDVPDIRTRAREIIGAVARAPYFRGRVTVDVVSWDDPDAPAPMLATLSPQEAVKRGLPKPSDCDMTVVIFWARMGTPLAECKPDGTLYLSGTEWEFEDACRRGKPVLLYRCTEELRIGVRDPDFREKQRQQGLVDAFFDGFRMPDGSLRRGFTPYGTADDFAKRFQQDIESELTLIVGFFSDL